MSPELIGDVNAIFFVVLAVVGTITLCRQACKTWHKEEFEGKSLTPAWTISMFMGYAAFGTYSLHMEMYLFWGYCAIRIIPVSFTLRALVRYGKFKRSDYYLIGICIPFLLIQYNPTLALGALVIVNAIDGYGLLKQIKELWYAESRGVVDGGNLFVSYLTILSSALHASIVGDDWVVVMASINAGLLYFAWLIWLCKPESYWSAHFPGSITDDIEVCVVNGVRTAIFKPFSKPTQWELV